MLKTHNTQRVRGFVSALSLIAIVTLALTLRGQVLRADTESGAVITDSGSNATGTQALTRSERRALEQAVNDATSDGSSSDISVSSSSDSSSETSVSSETSASDVSTSASSFVSSSDVSVSSASSDISSVSSETSASDVSTSASSSVSSESSASSDAIGGDLLTDTVLGQPANIFPSFLIPKTSDFSAPQDVQDRVKITLTDDAGLQQKADESVVEAGAYYRITLTPPSAFRPGKYRFQANLNRTSGISAALTNFFRSITWQDTEQDVPLVDTYFNWGAMAVNIDKNSYAPGDTALVSAALVTDDGLPLCVDTLTATFNRIGKQTLSPFCSGSGETLTLQTPTGTSAVLTVDGTDADATRVMTQLIPLDSDPQISVQRTSVTRTEGGRTEHMQIRVQTAQTITGTMSEHVPAGFVVTNIQPAASDVLQNIDGTFITWDGLWQANAGRLFSYDYTTPATTPVFGLFGPLKLKGQTDGQTVIASSASSETETSASDVSTSVSSDTSSTDSSSTSFIIGTDAASSSDASSTLSDLSSDTSISSESVSSSMASEAVSGAGETSASDVSTSASTSESSASSDSSESSSTNTVGWIPHFFGNLLASLSVDTQNNLLFSEDRQWQLLSLTGTADFTSAERARRLTLERQKAVFAADASPTFKLVDTQLDPNDTRLLDDQKNMRTDIAYQEILHTVVQQDDVTHALDNTSDQTKADHTIIQTVITTAESLGGDTASGSTDTKDKLITALATHEADTTASTGTSSVLALTLTGPNGIKIHPNFHFAVGSVDLVIDPIRDFTPGLYSLLVTVTNPITGETQTFTQQFAWGVLAMNPNQDVYKEGDTAHIDFGVLNDAGEIVCDAGLLLHVVAPDSTTIDLSTDDHTIVKSETCGVKKAGLITPDFFTTLPLTQSGAYHLTLDGTINGKTRSITGILVVKNDAPFVLSRSGATRLWPFAPSPMDITVSFHADITGQIVETLPAGFTATDITPSGTMTTDADGDSHITWEGGWHAGDVQTFHYLYKAPEISPHFYLLGPVLIQSDQPFTGAHLTSSGDTID